VVADPVEKMVELEHYREKLDVLLAAETKIAKSLRIQREGFFQRYAGPELRLQYFRLTDALHDLRVTMLDLNGEVIDYINRLSENSRFIEHVLKLRDLKNRHEIKERTNLIELLSDENDPLVLNKQQRDRALLEEEFADDFEFLEIVERLRTPSELPAVKKRIAGAVPREILDNTREEESIDYDALYERFADSDEDLLGFVCTFPYEKARTDEEKLMIYLQIATTYANELDFKEEGPVHAGYRCMNIYRKGTR